MIMCFSISLLTKTKSAVGFVPLHVALSLSDAREPAKLQLIRTQCVQNDFVEQLPDFALSSSSSSSFFWSGMRCLIQHCSVEGLLKDFLFHLTKALEYKKLLT